MELSRCFEEGDGVPENLIEACAWLQVATSNGSAEAEKEYVFLRSRLSPEEIDEVEARAAQYTGAGADEQVDELVQRVEAGDEEALQELTALIAEKPSSVIAAEKLLNEACKGNDGLPTPEAIYQLILAAEKGDAPACIALAWFYLSAGRRESKFSQWMDGWDSLSRPDAPRYNFEELFEPRISDRSRAYAWLSVAATAGDEESCVELESLKRQLTFDEFEEGELLAQNYIARRSAMRENQALSNEHFNKDRKII
jgi:TPR repeat protein